ncbi:MAG: S-layer protein, partial [Thermotogae bacterium]
VPVTEPITVLDTELLERGIENVDSNLILVGGPVANAITKYLVDQGLSTVDWENSDGEFEYLEDVFGEYDVLIVAGKDRYATREAAKELMEYLAGL